jgi:DNA-binding transcriptional LysR family regulator
VALLMAWMPLPTASQCAIVVSVNAINRVMFQATLAGQGVMLADDLLAKSAVERGELVRPFNIPIHSGSDWLVSRNFNHLSKNASRFAEWLIEELRAA